MCLDQAWTYVTEAPARLPCVDDLSRSVPMATEKQDNDLSTLMSGNVCLGVTMATTVCYNSFEVKIKTVVMEQASGLWGRRARAVSVSTRCRTAAGAHVLHAAGGVRGDLLRAAERAGPRPAPAWASPCAPSRWRARSRRRARARSHMLTLPRLCTTTPSSRPTRPGTCTFSYSTKLFIFAVSDISK